MTAATEDYTTLGHELARHHWLTFGRETALHGPAGLSDEEAHELVAQGGVEDVRMLCGRRAGWAMLPGVFSRMGLLRCGQCCDRAGHPRGHGSPKNDHAIRAKEGWDS